MNKTTLLSKEIEVNLHEKKEQRKTKFSNLFVKNLPPGTNDE